MNPRKLHAKVRQLHVGMQEESMTRLEFLNDSSDESRNEKWITGSKKQDLM